MTVLIIPRTHSWRSLTHLIYTASPPKCIAAIILVLVRSLSLIESSCVEVKTPFIQISTRWKILGRKVHTTWDVWNTGVTFINESFRTLFFYAASDTCPTRSPWKSVVVGICNTKLPLSSLDVQYYLMSLSPFGVHVFYIATVCRINQDFLWVALYES